MKKLYFLILTAFIFNFTFANPVITAIQDGSWTTASTWDKNRVPKNGDTVMIPAARKITAGNLFNAISLDNVYIKILGNLQLTGLFSSLVLDDKSTVVISTGGSLSNGSFGSSINLGGKDIYSNYSPIYGPQMANSTSGGFNIFNPLPIKFESFTLSRTNNSVLVQWSVSQEVNVSMYEVERSLDGTTWSTIAYVAPVTTAGSIKNYSFTDKSISAKIIYYRIKEVDVDGKANYSSICSIRTDVSSAASEIKIAALSNRVLLQFPSQVKGQVVIRFVSLSGQVMDQQVISNPQGQVLLNSKLTGNYIISVSNGQDISTAKQVIL